MTEGRVVDDNCRASRRASYPTMFNTFWHVTVALQDASSIAASWMSTTSLDQSYLARNHAHNSRTILSPRGEEPRSLAKNGLVLLFRPSLATFPHLAREGVPFVGRECVACTSGPTGCHEQGFLSFCYIACILRQNSVISRMDTFLRLSSGGYSLAGTSVIKTVDMHTGGEVRRIIGFGASYANCIGDGSRHGSSWGDIPSWREKPC